MTNRDFAVAVNKMFYALNNIGSDEFAMADFSTGSEYGVWLPKWFHAFEKSGLVQHLAERWESNPDFNAFYAKLDAENRMAVLQWINENYTNPEGFGLGIE